VRLAAPDLTRLPWRDALALRADPTARDAREGTDVALTLAAGTLPGRHETHPHPREPLAWTAVLMTRRLLGSRSE
jgi:hypothetical protein